MTGFTSTDTDKEERKMTMTLNFTTRERYSKAVRRLLRDDGQFQIVVYGKYLHDGNYFGFVEFKRKRG